jgi:predicted Rossmann fold flavoprotein
VNGADVVVVGGGAAGILAAWRAAVLGARVHLLEKTNRLGTKILISGGGKCNITHDGPIEEVLSAFRANEARFIRPSCYRFTNQDILDLLSERGLRVMTREDGRVFPVDQTAKDVVRILGETLRDAGVTVSYETAVRRVIVKDEEIVGVQTKAGEIACSHLVVAVGGSSYPNSGASGDGYHWMREIGHTVLPIRPALAPMELEKPLAEMSGVALRDCTLLGRGQGKKVAEWRGDLLLTHRGVSGPNALGISREVAEAMERGPATLEVDLAPGDDFSHVDGAIQSAAKDHPRRRVSQAVQHWMPESLVGTFMALHETDPECIGANLDRNARRRLTGGIKGWNLGPVSHIPLEKGEVVAGGVELSEVEPNSMRSKRIRGLYLCGEILDVAGPVGGYNLQAAWATGYVAGETAAMDALER